MGATFAAFPMWYATMFSGFYLALFLMLFGLIIRGVAFEFRSKDYNPKWRSLWDWAIFFGSLIPGLLIGVAFANLAAGVPIGHGGRGSGPRRPIPVDRVSGLREIQDQLSRV